MKDADFKKCPENRLEMLKMANPRRLNNSISHWQATVFATCIAVLLSAPLMLEPCGTAGIAFAQGQESPSRTQDGKDGLLLEAGKPIERELAGGQAHYYRIIVEAGQYLHLVVEQREIGVVVALYGPDDRS
jgi:hypothetical protein